MGLFQKLFGKDASDKIGSDGKSGLTPEQFLQTDFIRDISIRYRKTAMVLNPSKSVYPIDAGESKFGGTPNLQNFDSFPCCDSCGDKLNFVLQLYRKEFPAHYWPGNNDLFQLFRCPNDKCPSAYSAPYCADRKMFVYYFENTRTTNSSIQLPIQSDDNDHEPPVPDCPLNPAAVADFPNYEDFDNVITDIEHKFGETFSDLFIDEFSPIQRTKSGGYPSFTQSSHYPICSCGQQKEFFFQLSSEDTEPHVTNPVPDNWSPHGIMIGDLGNIYFYVCPKCGEKSIESYWDCY